MEARTCSGYVSLVLFLSCLTLVSGQAPWDSYWINAEVKYVVTLNVFSGRPDPYWVIDDSNGDYEVLSSAIDNSDISSLEDELGYRGFTIEMKNGYGQVKSKTIGGKSDWEVEDLLLNSCSDCGDDLKTHVNLVINGNKPDYENTNADYNVSELIRPRRNKRQAIHPAEGCKPPRYDPDKWNSSPTIRLTNNCYNYANNIRTDTFAQPGRASGKMFSSIEAKEMLKASIRDGLIVWKSDNGEKPNNVIAHRNNGNGRSDNGNGRTSNAKSCVLALVIWPSLDFHWYRLDSNNYWSHKPGRTAAKDVDSSGNKIWDPSSSSTDRGPYTQFVAFMHGTEDVRII